MNPGPDKGGTVEPRKGETSERNVEIKVFASYSNATCGALDMNRMSFVELKRGGGEVERRRERRDIKEELFAR